MSATRLSACVAGMLSCVAATANAYPDRAVHERNWGVSAEWVTFVVPGNLVSPRRVTVQFATVSSVCRDRVGRDLCGGQAALIDLAGHVFSQRTGRVEAGAVRCLANNRCSADFQLRAGRYSVMLHGGPLSRGLHSVRVRAAQTTGGATSVLATQDVQVSDNIMLDVGAAPRSFDVHSVLVSDGPTNVDEVTGAILSEGNTVNDWLGVDATEAWLFDDQLRVIDADLAMSGVGPAALVRGALSRRGVAVRYVLVRPFRAPPFSVAASDGTAIRMDSSEYPAAVGAGRMRVLLNDGQDSDGDRLSDQLEYELGLCDGRSAIMRSPGFSPMRCTLESEVREGLGRWQPGQPLLTPSDPRDTDGDGVSDGAEVLGTDVVEAQLPDANGGRPIAGSAYERITNAAQLLPLWGFDPRHKDLLIEIDRETQAIACASATDQCDVDRSVYPSPNYGSVDLAFDALWNWRRSLATLPARRVRNPDGRAGIELHFDVRFAKVSTAAHGMAPQDVPTSAALSARFAKAGFIIHYPMGDSTARCSCGQAQMAPDPRHGGLAHYMLGLMGGGADACDREITAQVGLPDTVASHEFGHTMGLLHGGPTAACFANPFAPRDPRDLGNEDKVTFPSIMNYAYDYRIAYQANHDRVGGEVYSAGRNWPLPRDVPTDVGAVLGWPELYPWGREARTDVVELWRPAGSGDGEGFYRPLPCAPGFTGNSCIDFNFNREIDRGFIATGVIEPGQAISAAGTLPQAIAGYRCDNGGAIVGGGALCCPVGSLADAAGVCRDSASAPVEKVGGSLGTLFNMAMQAPFVARPAASAPRRMYTLYQADLGANETANVQVGRYPTGEGKVRWLALDTLQIPDPTRTDAFCTGYDDDCGRLSSGASSRGDVRVDGAPLRMDGPGTIAAAVLPSAISTSEALMVARAGRECTVQLDTMASPPRRVDCAWSAPRFAIGRVSDLESSAGSLRSVTILGAPARLAGVAVAAWSATDATPSRFLVVMRDAATNALSWSSCGADGACTSAAAVTTAAGLSVTSPVSQIALSAQPGTRRLALLHSVQQGTLAFLAITELSASSTGLRSSDLRRVLQAAPGTAPMGLVPESAMSAAFAANGVLVAAFELRNGQAIATSTSDPFTSADVVMTARVKDWNVSRGAVATVTATRPSLANFYPSPGTSYAVFFDDRAALEALGALPGGARDAAFDGNFANVVRAWGYQLNGGIIQQFFGRVDGVPLAPRYDYEEATTLAYQLCNTIQSGSRGLRGADMGARSATFGLASRLLCPGAAAWDEAPGNVLLRELVWPPRRLRPGEDVERIATLVTGASWYGAAAAPVLADPRSTSNPAPIPQCTLGHETGAWIQYEQQRSQAGTR